MEHNIKNILKDTCRLYDNSVHHFYSNKMRCHPIQNDTGVIRYCTWAEWDSFWQWKALQGFRCWML